MKSALLTSLLLLCFALVGAQEYLTIYGFEDPSELGVWTRNDNAQYSFSSSANAVEGVAATCLDYRLTGPTAVQPRMFPEDSYFPDITGYDGISFNYRVTNPVAVEIPDNGIDEDCDGEDLIITSTNDLALLKVQVLPNPAADVVQIHAQEPLISWSAYNIGGQLIQTGTFGNSNHSMNVSQWNPGVYTVRVQAANGDKMGVVRVTVL